MHTLATPHVSYAVPHVLVPLTLSCYAGVCVCVRGGMRRRPGHSDGSLPKEVLWQEQRPAAGRPRDPHLRPADPGGAFGVAHTHTHTCMYTWDAYAHAHAQRTVPYS
jgi:hypothetical protein